MAQSRGEDILLAMIEGESAAGLPEPQSRGEVLLLALLDKINHLAELAGELPIHICTSGEYDTTTGVPTVQNPKEDIFYLVPNGTGNNLYTEWIYDGNAWEQFGSGNVPVEDIRINNSSIVNNGVANIPFAGTSSVGVVKYDSSKGVSVDGVGLMSVNSADSAAIKSGIDTYKPIVPATQHEAAFYGLAEAAGDISQIVSQNPVGTYTEGAKSAIRSMIGAGGVSDVQVNGTSVVNANGIAEIPKAGYSAFGAVKVSPTYGIDIGTTGQHVGYIRIAPPIATKIKSGTGYYDPINIDQQHIAAFYGLAKAAGDTTQSSSSNDVGAYTDEAKVAIQKMLGLYREWELIAEHTVLEDSEAVEVVTDISGQAFALSEILAEVWLEPSTTGDNSYMLASFPAVNTDDVDTYANAPTKRYMTNGVKTFMDFKGEIISNISYSTGSSTSAPNSTGSIERIISNGLFKYYRGFRISKYGASTSLVPAGTTIKIYGIRI